jgi:hypothetical protein
MTESKKIKYKKKTNYKKTKKHVGSGPANSKQGSQEEEEKQYEINKINDAVQYLEDANSSDKEINEVEKRLNEIYSNMTRRKINELAIQLYSELQRRHPELQGNKEKIEKKILEYSNEDITHILYPWNAKPDSHDPSLTFGGRKKKLKVKNLKKIKLISDTFVENLKLQQLGGQKKAEVSYVLKSIRNKKR